MKRIILVLTFVVSACSKPQPEAPPPDQCLRIDGRSYDGHTSWRYGYGTPIDFETAAGTVQASGTYTVDPGKCKAVP